MHPNLTRPTARRSATALGLVSALVVMMASPALAATGSGSGGSGVLVTDLTVVSSNPPCARVEGSFAYSATVPSGTYTSGNATYSGPVSLQFVTDSNGPYYEGPEGTYGTDSSCNSSSLGDPWGIIALSSGTNSQGSTVRCEYFGEYSRVDFVEMSQSLDGDCDIDENGTDGSDLVTGSATHEERTSTIGECVDNPTGPPEQCDTEDDAYVATNN